MDRTEGIAPPGRWANSGNSSCPKSMSAFAEARRARELQTGSTTNEDEKGHNTLRHLLDWRNEARLSGKAPFSAAPMA
jgi:hypothetical protein